MRDHLADRAPVADHKALEIPAALENVVHQVGIGGRRNAVEVVEGIHEGRGAGGGGGLERRQVSLPELAQAHVDRVVVAPAHRGPIAGEMLRAGHHAVECPQPGALEARDARGGDARAQVRVFSRPFHDAPPAWIARNVEHRREGPVHACGRRFGGRDTLGLSDGFQIPACGFGQRDRKAGLVAVNDVLREQQRDMQSRLQRQFLVVARLRSADDVQDRAHSAGADGLHAIGPDRHRPGGIVGVRHLHQLADFLSEAHLGEQCFYARGDRVPGRWREVRAGRRCQQAAHRECAAEARKCSHQSVPLGGRNSDPCWLWRRRASMPAVLAAHE